MLKTMLIGNLVYAAVVCGLWFVEAGDRSKFVPAFIFVTLAFFGGVVTGVVGCQPGKQQKKIAMAVQKSKKRRSTAAAANALDSMLE